MAATLREVERLVVGDKVSFRGSGDCRYRVRAVIVRDDRVRLTLDWIGHPNVLTTEYRMGDLAQLWM